ncbi:hypothetical protein B0H15DRAFT_540137 [Mycena belliarum]|uniref:Uncharacterized protein n=1 Tax=Mycena belliarum TaxID=1033014 RepID=A0AAD6TXP8_9AGAR|nr:hypothetical protein B0H15DRAFT_540137 [Mycena belliae]
MFLLLLTLFARLATSIAYIWPSPKLDALEAFRWDQDGTTVGFAAFFQPCEFNNFEKTETTPSGRANGPDWIRTAYHGMATHNIEDGTGGLDASIRFPEELARGQNAGDGFANTLAFLTAFITRHISLADMIAIGSITAVETLFLSAVDALTLRNQMFQACRSHRKAWTRISPAKGSNRPR